MIEARGEFGMPTGSLKACGRKSDAKYSSQLRMRPSQRSRRLLSVRCDEVPFVGKKETREKALLLS